MADWSALTHLTHHLAVCSTHTHTHKKTNKPGVENTAHAQICIPRAEICTFTAAETHTHTHTLPHTLRVVFLRSVYAEEVGPWISLHASHLWRLETARWLIWLHREANREKFWHSHVEVIILPPHLLLSSLFIFTFSPILAFSYYILYVFVLFCFVFYLQTLFTCSLSVRVFVSTETCVSAHRRWEKRMHRSAKVYVGSSPWLLIKLCLCLCVCVC